MYKNITEEKIMFFEKRLSKLSAFQYLEPGLDFSVTDIAEVMNTLIQEKHSNNESCITDKRSRRTQKVDIYLAN